MTIQNPTVFLHSGELRVLTEEMPIVILCHGYICACETNCRDYPEAKQKAIDRVKASAIKVDNFQDIKLGLTQSLPTGESFIALITGEFVTLSGYVAEITEKEQAYGKTFLKTAVISPAEVESK